MLYSGCVSYEIVRGTFVWLQDDVPPLGVTASEQFSLPTTYVVGIAPEYVVES